MIEIDNKKFQAALNEIAATDNGKIVIAALKESCQWDETYLSSENPQLTQFYAVRRGIYGGLRKLIRTEHLKQIEFNYKIKVNNDGRDNNDNNINSRAGKSSTRRRATRDK